MWQMTSATKPEVHNVSYRNAAREEPPRPQLTCIKIWWSSVVHVVSEICERSDKHTYSLIHHKTSWRSKNEKSAAAGTYAQIDHFGDESFQTIIVEHCWVLAEWVTQFLGDDEFRRERRKRGVVDMWSAVDALTLHAAVVSAQCQMFTSHVDV